MDNNTHTWLEPHLNVTWILPGCIQHVDTTISLYNKRGVPSTWRHALHQLQHERPYFLKATNENTVMLGVPEYKEHYYISADEAIIHAWSQLATGNQITRYLVVEVDLGTM